MVGLFLQCQAHRYGWFVSSVSSTPLWLVCFFSVKHTVMVGLFLQCQAHRYGWFVSSVSSTPLWLVCFFSVKHTVMVGWFLHCFVSQPHAKCISGMDALRWFCELSHWDRSCRSNLLSHPVTEYWCKACKSQHWMLATVTCPACTVPENRMWL